jgi:hypothetical protein
MKFVKLRLSRLASERAIASRAASSPSVIGNFMTVPFCWLSAGIAFWFRTAVTTKRATSGASRGRHTADPTSRSQHRSSSDGQPPDACRVPERDGGPTGVICAKRALLDFGVSARGFNVEVLSVDHQNKPDVGV